MSLPQASTLLLAVSSCGEELAFLTETFRDTTWRLREARTYRDALTILCLDRMPVVICRCCLPDGNWKDVLSQIAVLPDAPRLIVTSPEPDDRLWAEVITLGGYDVLTMPLDRNEVIWAVGRACVRRQLFFPVDDNYFSRSCCLNRECYRIGRRRWLKRGAPPRGRGR
jgi:DNA-binding NtrC family response regulator